MGHNNSSLNGNQFSPHIYAYKKIVEVLVLLILYYIEKKTASKFTKVDF